MNKIILIHIFSFLISTLTSCSFLNKLNDNNKNKAFYQEGYGYSAGKLWSTYTLENGDYTFSCRDSESLKEKDVIYGFSGGLIRNLVYDEKYIFYSNRGNLNLNIYEDESKTIHRINLERFIYKDKLANGAYASSSSSIYKDKDTYF